MMTRTVETLKILERFFFINDCLFISHINKNEKGQKLQLERMDTLFFTYRQTCINNSRLQSGRIINL